MKGSRRFVYLWLAIAALAAGPAPAVHAQQPPAQSTDNGSQQGKLTVEDLKAKRALTESAADLDEAAKKTALSLLDQAIGFQETAARYLRDAETVRQRIQDAPARVKEIRKQLDREYDSPETITAMAEKMSIENLEQRATQEQLALETKKKALTDLNQQLAQQNRVLKQLPETIAGLKQRLQDLQAKIKAPPAATDAAPVAEARRLTLLAEQEVVRSELALADLLLSGQDANYSMLTAEQGLAAREAILQETAARAWQRQLQTRRQVEAVQAREQAEEAKSKIPVMPPVLQDQFDVNIELSAQLEELSREEAALVKELATFQQRLDAIDDEFNLARERVSLIVITETIGLALREQRRALPDADRMGRDSARRKLEMSRIQEHQIELERAKKDLADLDAAVAQITAKIGYLAGSPSLKEQLNTEVRLLLSNRRELIEKLQSGYQRSFKYLQNIETIEQELVKKAVDFADFLDRHLLWIPSSRPIGTADLPLIAAVLQSLILPSNWQLFVADTVVSLQQNTELWLLTLTLGALLVAGRHRARRELAETAEKVGRQEEQSFGPSLRALAMTLWLAASWPFLLGMPAFLLSSFPRPGVFTYPVASGLLTAAGAWLILGFFYQVCRINGLAPVHFGMSEPARRLLRSNLKWLIPLSATMNFFIGGTVRAENLVYGDPVARLALIITSAGLFVFIALTLRFSGGVVATLIERHPKSLFARLRYLWYPLALAVPLAQIALASTRYFHSALEMRNLVGITGVALLLLLIFYALTLRWLTMVRRKIALKEAAARTEPTVACPDSGDTVSVSGCVPEKELQQIDKQSRNLLRAVFYILALLVLWWIWEPIFPAFGVLKDIQLWSYTSTTGATAETVPITLADLILALAVAVATIFSARNLPGFLEVTLLSYFPIDFGARKAYATLTRYAIVAAGILVAFGTVGIRWSTIQWLVAALSVGLGFGLQEIVANFISGLIVLFERPFRVGDTVTIGDVSGTVSQIRIRATTIVDWDRRELIVPNKDFITGRLVNWSLSDPIIRLKIPVGIAYGSDTELAERLLMKAARENRLVLADPAPSAIFTEFGDNSLNFTLRVFINSIDHWFTVTHQLNRAIDRAFREAGIVVSFPQRDVHLDTAGGPLEVRVVSEHAKGSGGQDADEKPKTR
jgi:potassium efflux system protein